MQNRRQNSAYTQIYFGLLDGKTSYLHLIAYFGNKEKVPHFGEYSVCLLSVGEMRRLAPHVCAGNIGYSYSISLLA